MNENNILELLEDIRKKINKKIKNVQIYTFSSITGEHINDKSVLLPMDVDNIIEDAIERIKENKKP